MTYYIDGNDLMYNEFKLAEKAFDKFQFEDLDFLNKIHNTNLITEEMIEDGKKFAIQNGHKVY